MALHLNCRYLEGFVPQTDLETIAPEVRAAIPVSEKRLDAKLAEALGE